MIVVLMGVAGAGKTTVGRLLAAALGCEFVDADDFHPPENVAKMRAGRPLTDDDRWPWLARLNQSLSGRAGAVVACSALKERYRQALLGGLPDARLVYLRGTRALIAPRLAARGGHFMNPALLDSQFAALEEPRDAIVVDVDAAPAALVRAIRAGLGPAAPSAPPSRAATSPALRGRGSASGRRSAGRPAGARQPSASRSPGRRRARGA